MQPSKISVISSDISETNRALIEFGCTPDVKTVAMAGKFLSEGGFLVNWGDGDVKDEMNARPEKSVHNESMSELNRDELKAHLENQELKVDARLNLFEQRVAQGIVDMNNTLKLLDRDLSGVRGLKGTIILNSVLSVIAIVGIVVGVMAYGTSSFDSGRDTAQMVQDLRQQSNETKQILEQLKQSQKSQ
ncbi:hypothetical protein [Pseudomonas sp. CMR5c]|uniref:hypothetical protein n=1 Tax=Pseudomonas sp. CMR5c TaxID=658630 RepID=UPI000AF1A1F4|nr:hypothetical protein [Pseudomonas sp. CMR5c]AZC17550.1 hypothetical protein C4K40_2161 [Pseudomonas sp. CMR5c]